MPVELVRSGVQKAASSDADCLVAIGGGAAIGLCKGIAYETGLPIIAIPTTYCGSEMTGYCGMTSDGVKRMHESLAMRPSVVIYDAELSMSLPPSTSASSAMNALAHCIDAVYLPSLSPLLAPAAVEGARIVATTLPALLADPDDLVPAQRNALWRLPFRGSADWRIRDPARHRAHARRQLRRRARYRTRRRVCRMSPTTCSGHAPAPLGRIADAVGHRSTWPVTVWDLAVHAGLPVRLGATSDSGRRTKTAACRSRPPPTRRRPTPTPTTPAAPAIRHPSPRPPCAPSCARPPPVYVRAVAR